MLSVRILGTGSFLPGRPVPTAELAACAAPDQDPAAIEAKIGIRTRYRAEPDMSMAEVGATALRRALAAAGLPATALRRVIFTSSTGGEFITPPTVNAIINALGANNLCDGFDLNNACMGFLTALHIGACSVQAGLGPVGIVATELGSRCTTPKDPRPYLVFGDAAGAVVLGAGRPGEGILGMTMGNDGERGDTARMRNFLFSGEKEYVRFPFSNQEMRRMASELLFRCTASVLAQCEEDIADIEWVLPHQPNGSMLDLIIRSLDIDPARVVPVVAEIGSVASASIPVSLDRLMRTKPVKPGDRVLMLGVGVGLSYGAALYRVGPS